MALDYTTAEMGVCSDVFDGFAEQSVDGDITLPDYCPDVLRILKCTITPCVIAAKHTGDRVGADGNALVQILYADEENNLCAYTQSYPFSGYAETGGERTGALFADARVSYVNCRAVNRRRVEVHGMLRLSFRLCAVTKQTIVNGIADENVQTKTETVSYSDLTSCVCKQFPVSETAELPQGAPPMQRMIHASAAPILQETKIIQGKLLLKGEIPVRAIYCAEENGGECETFDYTIPLNQVVEAAGVTDDCDCAVCLRIVSAEFPVRADAENAPRLLDVNLVLCAEIQAFRPAQTDCITDAYSVAGTLDAAYETLRFCKRKQQVRETFTCREQMDLSALDAKQITALWFGDVNLQKKVSDGRRTLSGCVPACMLLLDGDGRPLFCEREFRFDYAFPASVGADDCVLPCVVIGGQSCGAISDGKAEIRAEFILTADVFDAQQRRVMVSASLAEDSASTDRCAAMIVYFADCEESVWEIARKYGTTADAIKTENGITTDTVECGKPIMIPVR